MRVYSKLMGVTFGFRQVNIYSFLKEGMQLTWKHDKENKYDSNAILCYADEAQKFEVGFISRELAAKIAPILSHYDMVITVSNLTGDVGMSRGVNVLIELFLRVDDVS